MADLVAQLILPITLAFIMLIMGLGLDLRDFTELLAKPKKLLVGLILQMGLLPLLALLIASAFQLPAAMAAGLVLLSLCPGGATSNMFSYLARGDVALSVSLTAITSVLVPFVLPIVFASYISLTDAEQNLFTMPVLLMMKQLVIVTLLPLLIGMAIRKALGDKVKSVESLLKRLASNAMALVILLLMATNWSTLSASISVIGAAVLCMCISAIAIAYYLAFKCKFDLAAVKTLALEVGVQNAGTAMMVAFVVLQQPQLAFVPLMYGLLMNIPAFAFVFWARYDYGLNETSEM